MRLAARAPHPEPGLRPDELEGVTLNRFAEGQGSGKALPRAFGTAGEAGLRRVWLTTSNEKVSALGGYQRGSMRLVAVPLDAVTRTRTKNPSLLLVSEDGIPIRNEWELEWRNGS